MRDHNDERGGPWTHGQLPDIEAYPFQTLDVPYDNNYGRDWFWLQAARTCAEIWRSFALTARDGKTRGAGEFKWPGRTPLGTSVCDLVRKDNTGRLAGIKDAVFVDGGWAEAGDSWHPGDSRDMGPGWDRVMNKGS